MFRIAKRRTTAHADYLRGVPLFAGLSDRDLETVSRAASDLRFRSGRTLVRQGSAAQEMMILTRGTATVTRDGERVAELGPGDVLGELAVLSGAHRTATVTASSDVELVHVTAARLSQLLDDVPAIARKMLPVVATRAVADDGERAAAVA